MGVPVVRPLPSPAVISTNQFKNGNHIEVDGTIFKILEFQHVKPGKGGAFVRTKLRRASDGNVIDRTFRAGEKFRAVRTEARKMQFLYADGADAHFMDTRVLRADRGPASRRVAEALRWMQPEQRGGRAVHRRRARRPAAAERGRPRGHPDRARAARRHGLRRRHQAGDARDRRDRSRCRCSSSRASASASTRAPATTWRGLRCAVDAPLRAAPGGGDRALPARPHRPAAGRDARPATRSLFARALAHAAADRADELDELIDRHAHGWSVAAHPAAGAQHHARRAGRDAAPRAAPGATRRSRPRERSRRPSRAPRCSAARTLRASSTACSRQSCARCARMPQQPMSSVERPSTS